MQGKATKLLEKLSVFHHNTALTFFNILILVILLNVALFAAFAIKDSITSNPVSAKYGPALMTSLYDGLSENDIDSLLKETWTRPYVYQPFTQFEERPYRGTYVNVDSNGFRQTKNQGPWPLC